MLASHIAARDVLASAAQFLFEMGDQNDQRPDRSARLAIASRHREINSGLCRRSNLRTTVSLRVHGASKKQHAVMLDPQVHESLLGTARAPSNCLVPRNDPV
jgi:hypothetical protein